MKRGDFMGHVQNHSGDRYQNLSSGNSHKIYEGKDASAEAECKWKTYVPKDVSEHIRV